MGEQSTLTKPSNVTIMSELSDDHEPVFPSGDAAADSEVCSIHYHLDDQGK